MVTSISVIQLDQLAGFPKEFCIPLSTPSVLPSLDAAVSDDSQVSALFHAVMWQVVRMGQDVASNLGSPDPMVLHEAGLGTRAGR